MIKLQSLSVVLPTYNERENLPILIDSLEEVLGKMKFDSHIVVVDDNSPDGTGAVADEMCKKYDNIHALHRKGKMGLGSAYKAGFKYVLDTFDPDIIIQMDADNSHSPRYISEMVRMVSQGKDVVIGSRRVDDGTVTGWGYYRKSVSSTANAVARVLCGLDVKDATSGYRAYSAKSLQLIDFEQIQSDGYAFQVEMLCKMQKLGCSIAELPIEFVDRREGKSKLDSNEMLEFLGVCTRLMLER
jgi:glycosyltransferase involved in cell wall biosynthesis